MEASENKCILCAEKLSELKIVKVKRGLQTLKDISLKRKDGIAEKLEGVEEIELHVHCRKLYTKHPDRLDIPLFEPCAAVPLLRSNIQQFDFKMCCLYCGEKIDKEDAKKHPERYSRICKVETLGKISTIRSICEKRNDDWSRIVRNRIDTEYDLVAAEAQYHKNCDCLFATIASCMPSQLSANIRGRPCDEVKIEAFHKLCCFLENNDECQYLISDLLQKMSEFSTDGSAYSERYLKEQLIGRYGDSILLSPSNKSFGTIVSFRPLASRVLTDKWYSDRRNNVIEEKKRILDAAIAIVQEEILSQVHDYSSYPTSAEISNGGAHQMGEMLGHLLSGLMKPIKGKVSDRKVLTVAHCIISSVRSRSFVSAVQMGIGVFLHRRFRSRHLIDLLHNLGLCVSYSEICKYEASVTLHLSNEVSEEGFVQFVFDNADHNARTFDGHGTFHVLGGVQCVTPASALRTEICVPRPKTLPNAPMVGKFGFIPIRVYNRPKNTGLNSIKFEDVLTLKLRLPSAHLASIYDWIWMAGPGAEGELHTGWSGYMEIAVGQHAYEKSAVIPLPFVNLQSTNLTAINTCIRFAIEECKKRQQKCIVTFDQPLFIKAIDLVLQADKNDELSSIIVRLGGFHLLMNYMAAVGKIMGGSGLEEMWAEVYAQNAVVHMINGHAYTRALRAHSLSQAAIACLIFEYCLEIQTMSTCDMKALYEIYNESLNSGTDKRIFVFQGRTTAECTRSNNGIIREKKPYS